MDVLQIAANQTLYLQNIMKSLERLFQQLELARIRHLEDQREGSLDALAAITEFLESTGAPAGAATPLLRLAHEFESPKVGNEKPLFDAHREGIAAAAVDLLKETGLSLDLSCNAVSQAMGGHLGKKQLRYWRANLREGKSRPEAVEAYDGLKRNYKALSGGFSKAEHSQRREAILEMVRDSFGLKKS